MIREATVNDSQAIADIYNYYIANSTATFEEKELSTVDMEQRITKVLSSGNDWLVSESENKIVGYAYSSVWNARSAYRYTLEVSAYLAHDETSKGRGSQLYEQLFRTLKARGIKAVIAGITLPNDKSIALHEKFGMKKVAHFEKVGFKFNEWLDVGYWQCNFAN